MHLVSAPLDIHCASWSRLAERPGLKRIRVVSAGGIATTARRALTLRPSARARTPSGPCSSSCTGAARTTESPSSAAIRRLSSCEPPTIRSCWAPPSTSIIASKPPQELTRCSIQSSDICPAPTPNAVPTAISNRPRALRVLSERRSQAATVVASSAAASGALQGASGGTVAASRPSRRRARSTSSSTSGDSRGIVPL